jgi:CO dehydrogenase nickel-insertion accessory protein CooC1
MKVLTATKALAVFEFLEDLEDIEQTEALFTGRIYDALSEVQFVIVDFEDVVEQPYDVEMLRRVFAENEILFASSEEFLSQPEHWIQEARRVRGQLTKLPKKRVIAFAAYAGGTGKTTLSLDTALHFARRTAMPVLAVEFTYGVSALAALTGLEMPHLFDLATQLDVVAARWKGVTLVPMDYDSCQDLPIQRIARYLEEEMNNHVLTVVDATWPHPLIGAVQEEVDEWFAVATPRVDAVENAEKLRDELGSKKASIIVNRRGGVVDSLALSRVGSALDLPEVRRPDQYDGKLGKQVLSLTYGPKTWRKYEKGFVDRLRDRLAPGRAGD